MFFFVFVGFNEQNPPQRYNTLEDNGVGIHKTSAVAHGTDGAYNKHGEVSLTPPVSSWGVLLSPDILRRRTEDAAATRPRHTAGVSPPPERTLGSPNSN